MADTSKNSDSVDVRLGSEDIDPTEAGEGQTFAVDNDVRVVVEDGTLPPIPDKPADNAARDTWVEYVVALGAGVESLEDVTVKELKALAKHLGG